MLLAIHFAFEAKFESRAQYHRKNLKSRLKWKKRMFAQDRQKLVGSYRQNFSDRGLVEAMDLRMGQCI